SFYFFLTDFVCVCLLVHNQKPCLRSSSACDRQTHREDSAQLAYSEFCLLYYIFKYKQINTCINSFFFFLLFFKLILCVFACYFITRSHSYAVPVPATDRHTERTAPS